MQLVNQEMLMLAAARASGLTKLDLGPFWIHKHTADRVKLSKQTQLMDVWTSSADALQDAAQPLLRTVWFNAW
jgi:hypothetical protein